MREGALREAAYIVCADSVLAPIFLRPCCYGASARTKCVRASTDSKYLYLCLLIQTHFVRVNGDLGSLG